MSKSLWHIDWGTDSDLPHMEFTEVTYPYRSTPMAALDINASVTTVKTSTRTLNLDPDDVEAILLNWAVTHYGFTHAEVHIHGLQGYDFKGVHISEGTLETTIDPPEVDEDFVPVKVGG
jgi:hypothetical protein